MNNYIIEWIATKEDKRGEIGYFRLKSRNGNIIMQSEKYKNVSYSRTLAIKISRDLNVAKYKEIDRRY